MTWVVFTEGVTDVGDLYRGGDSDVSGLYREVVSDVGGLYRGVVSDVGDLYRDVISDEGGLTATGSTVLTLCAVSPDDVTLMMIFGTATLLKLLPLNCTPHPPLQYTQGEKTECILYIYTHTIQ